MDAYLPQDRRHALLQGRAIPERCRGAALFADLSGFTPLTEALSKALRPREAAERLARQITQLYDALTSQVDQWHGSVVGFAGDAVTCWFDDQDAGSVERAVACALAMQQAMPSVAALTLPNGETHTLALKVSIAYGPARRMVVGDPQIQQFDVLAGSTLLEVAAIEHLARPGEILISEAAAVQLGYDGAGTQWLTDPEGVRATPITHLISSPVQNPWSVVGQATLQPAQLRPWILPAIYERYQQGLSDFLSELRPAVPMFIRFASLDYDHDQAAGAYLNEFISAAQQIIHRYGGTLLQIVIGDKGSSMYAVFGAPISHENDASRAALAALELHQQAQTLPIIAPLQIGITQGTLLVGAYGTFPSRTYAAMGDSVNVAARLMMAAAPRETLVTDRIDRLVAETVQLEVRTPLRLKGKAQLQPVSVVLAPRQRRSIQLEEPRYQLPMVGRRAEREQIGQILSSVATGQGQILGISGEAGQGKSRLVAEAIRLAHAQGYTSYGGACLSIGKHMPYLVWEPIWQSFFELAPDSVDQEAAEHLRRRLDALVPDRVGLLPLLGPLLGVALPDNPFTGTLEPQDRQRALHALLRDCLVAAVRVGVFPRLKMLFILEDLHWIDELSYVLLNDLARIIFELPVLIIVAYRSEQGNQANIQRLAEYPYWNAIELSDLDDKDAMELIRIKTRQLDPDISEASVGQLHQYLLPRTQNNPFYLEELLNYLYDQKVNLRDPADLVTIELPDSVQRLVLSRLDRLTVKQQALMKSASVIGRRFLIAWLQGAFGTMNYTDNLYSELNMIKKVELIDIDIQDPELAYVFKHIITRDVAYSSLSDATRSMLHEYVAVYLEQLVGTAPDAYLDLLAYHYDNSNNIAKRRKYLRLAGDSARARYANEAAISYFTRALALLPDDDLAGYYELMMLLDGLYEIIGDIKSQENNINALVEMFEHSDNVVYRVNVILRRAEFFLPVYGAQRSIAAADEVYHIAISENMLDLAARALICYSWAAINLGQHDTGELQTKKAMDLALQCGSREIEVSARKLLVNWLVAASRYAESLEVIPRTISLCKDLNMHRNEANMLHFLAIALFETGKIESAFINLEQAIALYSLVDDRQYTGMALAHMMLFACLCGDFARSYDYIDRLGRWFHSMEINSISIYRLWATAMFYDQIGDYEQANGIAEQALEKANSFESPFYIGIYLNLSAWVRFHLGEVELALERSKQSLALISQVLIGHDYAFALTVNGHILAHLGQWEAAEHSYVESYNLRKQFQQHHLVNEPLAGIARSAFALQRWEEAKTHVDEILVYLEHHRLDGVVELFQIYLTCYDILSASADERAAPLLKSAYDQLQLRAGNLPDQERQQRFLAGISVHHRLVTLSKQMFDHPHQST